MTEDEIDRNRRWAKTLLFKGADLTKKGFKAFGEGLDAAAKDLERGKPKAAEAKLAKVEKKAEQTANTSSNPVTVHVALQLASDAREAREKIERGSTDPNIIDAEYRVVE